ncbi:NAD(P)H-dependent oxidoreductase [Streptomyces sp. HNM0645]|uniref:NAD(P)H-dependent oxidoreductase n=1 Tax=Streptomyces sp. HNM0645 TaxID=2782343 RepID=UPI0024B79C89|nr:NAD(P)H-dependent oxidoreductase [Streptomyces sp. HNM0645]MDI9883325.1 NAD(P)H-dependent oxidoreductase [Streptomyces sp. HNM0645]
MTNVAVIYYSSTGSTHRLAEAAAEAAAKEGAEVRLRRVAEFAATGRAGSKEHAAATADIPEASLDDLEWADAILLGSPVHFGLAAPQLMQFINTTSALSIPGKLLNKAVSAFASGSAEHGGQVTTILALHNAICHWGSVIVATGSTDAVLYEKNNGNPYGAGTVAGNRPGFVHEENIGAIAYQTRRTIEVAAALNTSATVSVPVPVPSAG